MQMVKLLLDKGARVDGVDNRGNLGFLWTLKLKNLGITFLITKLLYTMVITKIARFFTYCINFYSHILSTFIHIFYQLLFTYFLLFYEIIMNFEGRSCLSIGVESGIDAIIELLLDFDANMEVNIDSLWTNI